jgi:hypothetical protein
MTVAAIGDLVQVLGRLLTVVLTAAGRADSASRAGISVEISWP